MDALNTYHHPAKLRELSKKNTRFVLAGEYQATYEALIERFKKNTLLQYIDMGKQTFISTDAHKTGLGALLTQGDSVENAKPVARHPDDMKPFKLGERSDENEQEGSEGTVKVQWPEADAEEDGHCFFEKKQAALPLRRSERTRKPNPKYI